MHTQTPAKSMYPVNLASKLSLIINHVINHVCTYFKVFPLVVVCMVFRIPRGVPLQIFLSNQRPKTSGKCYSTHSHIESNSLIHIVYYFIINDIGLLLG